MLQLPELKLYLEVKRNEKSPKLDDSKNFSLKKTNFLHIFKMCFLFLTDRSAFVFEDSHKCAFS